MKSQVLVLLCALLAATNAHAEICAAPWQRVGRQAQEVVRPVPLGLVAGAAVAPLAMIPTGADHELRLVAQDHWGGSYDPEPVSIPTPYVLVPATVIVYVSGVVGKSCVVQRHSTAVIQGMTWTLVTVGTLKWVTGRTWPLAGRDPDSPERLEHPEDAREFLPFRRGLGAFPSGHTAVMFAAAAALRASAPQWKAWRYVGYPFAAAMGFAMWYGDHHWASDVVSGALLGEALGGAAGRAWAETPEDAVTWMLAPTVGGAAVQVSGRF